MRKQRLRGSESLDVEMECAASFERISRQDYESLNFSHVINAVQDTMNTTTCTQRDQLVLWTQDSPIEYQDTTLTRTSEFRKFNEADFNACKQYLYDPGSLLVPSIKS